eukprot:2011574-Amphidinium_carterae.1
MARPACAKSPCKSLLLQAIVPRLPVVIDSLLCNMGGLRWSMQCCVTQGYLAVPGLVHNQASDDAAAVASDPGKSQTFRPCQQPACLTLRNKQQELNDKLRP